MRLAALIILSSACSDVADEVIPDPIEDLADLARDYCDKHPEWPCGTVVMCKGTPADNKLGFVEVCTLDATEIHESTLPIAEAQYGQCEPTPRHAGLCWWGCEPDHIGANAYNGCAGCAP